MHLKKNLYVHRYAIISWNISTLSRATSLKKTDYCPSPRCHQLPVASKLGIGLDGTLPCPCWNFGLILCRSCACSHNSCELMCAATLLCLTKFILLQISATSIFCSLPTPLFCNDPWALRGEGGIRMAHFELEIHNLILCVLTMVDLCVNFQLLIKKLLWWGLWYTPTYGYKEKNLWGKLLLCPFNKIIVLLVSPLETMT